MEAGRWQQVAEVLDLALASDPASWPSLLDERCGTDPKLRNEVEALLAHLDTAEGFLESPRAALARAVVAEAGETLTADQYAGRRIGAYQIVREIGRGGMSRVFLAERADGHFEQQVALKLLRPGLDSELDRERFRVERQILASLDHPNIARLLDGGVTEDSQPFLVMEYVEGQPIDDFCEQRALSVRQRIELFVHVADATQSAHRRLVVHRDLKPSNIFVTRDGEVKLLDFGLAKLLEPSSLSADGPMTRTGQRWMTPEYAAPEQVRGDPITTLTDVYQLGAVLYQLLTGELLFPRHRGNAPRLDSAVLRDDPLSPSIVVAHSRPELSRQLRGDLDAIVLKALRKEPEARYGSPAELARDLRRHISAEPVQARRQTTIYRVRRLIRRHRIEAIAVLGISASLVAGAIVSLAQANRAEAERDRAEAASLESEAVASFVLRLFEVSDPAEARGDTMTARDLLRRAVSRTEQFRGQPAAQARMLEVTARLYHSLGQNPEAHAAVERALVLRRSAGAQDGLAIAGTLSQLADARLRLGRNAAADSAARQALAIQERMLGREDPALAATTHQIGSIAIYLGDLESAELYHRRALNLRLRGLGANDSLTGTSHLFVGSTLRHRGRLAEAERQYRQAATVYERALGSDHPYVAEAVIHVAYLLGGDRARAHEAEPLYQRALEIRRGALGEAHPTVAATLSDIAAFHSRQGNHATAVPLAREYLRRIQRAAAPDHPMVPTATSRVASILYAAGELPEAEALFRSAIALERRIRGNDHPSIAGHEMDLARLLIDRDDFAAAEIMLRNAIRIRERAAGPDSPNAAASHGLLGMLLSRKGEYAAADSVLRYAIRSMERYTGRQHSDVKELYGWLADLHDAWGRPAEAVRYRAIATAD